MRTDIDQAPESWNEIVEIIGDHYHNAIAEGHE